MTQFKYKLIKAYLDGVLGTRAWGGRMEGSDESTELWRHPPPRIAKCCSQLRFVPVLHLVFLEEVKNMSELLYNRFHQQNLARKYNLSHT